MDKKIGNYLLLLCAIGTLQLHAEPHVQMIVTDMNGEQLQQAQINTPFMIQVTVVNDETDELPQPKIVGLDQLKLLQTSTQSSTVINNGAKTVSKTYNFTVKADQERTYTLGPCKVAFNNYPQVSSPVLLTVAKEQKIAQHQSVITEINFDQSKVYVGQKVTFTLRFYYLENKVRLQQIKEPAFEEFSKSKLQGPTTGRKEIDGVLYQYLEWKGTVYPTQSGLLTVDPVEATYSIQAKRRHNNSAFGFFADMSDFFGESRTSKRAFSNSLELDVRPLPDHTPPVKAVGNFTHFTGQLNTQKAGQGEGVVLTLELTGSGNSEQISHPILELPNGLSYYESTAKLLNKAGTQKQFEYIIQGLSSGNFTIPEQQFTFFDPQTAQYKTIQSKPLTLTITPSNTPDNQINQEPQQTESAPSKKQLTIITSGKWYATKQRAISLWLFLLLLCLPLLLHLLFILKQKRAHYLAKYAPEVAYKLAFKTARPAILHARKGGYNARLYHIFIDLFAARFKIAREQVTEQLIEETLEKQWDAHKLMKWRLFFGHMTECTFSSYGTTIRDDGLFNQATFWLQELEKVL